VLDVTACRTSNGAPETVPFQVKARVDTPLEIEYLKNGGVLNYVLRNFIQAAND
jgi:aconitate hydratase